MIYRGTTPTYTLTFIDENLDFGDANEIILTIADTNDNAILELSGNQLDVGTKTISFSLSQQQTLAMPKGNLPVQVNWTYTYGQQTKRACSNIVNINFHKNLHREVMA